MAAPFVGDVVSVATDRNEISLRNPATRRRLTTASWPRLRAVVLEMLAHARGVEAQPSLLASAEADDAELLGVVVDPSPRDRVLPRDVSGGHPTLDRAAR